MEILLRFSADSFLRKQQSVPRPGRYLVANDCFVRELGGDWEPVIFDSCAYSYELTSECACRAL